MNKFLLLILLWFTTIEAISQTDVKQDEVIQAPTISIVNNNQLQETLKVKNGQASVSETELPLHKKVTNTDIIQTTSTALDGVYLLTDIWGGVNCRDENNNNVYPLNYFTPNHYSAGCVAISMSQLLNYYEWPKTGVGSHTYTDNQGSSQKQYSVNFSNQTYNYDLMLDNYNGVPSTDAQQRAVGYLAYHAAVSLDMDFESEGSTSNVNQQPAALNNYFRFSGHYKTRSWGSFWTRMKENINNKMPVLLSIKDVDGGGAGHALVADGYRVSDGKFHLNWGWHNSNNGWYDIENSWNGTGGGYDRVEGATFDIIPDPEITEIKTVARQLIKIAVIFN